MKHFDGKVVVITGAGSGIGRALAVNLAGRGAVLALSDLDATGLQETADLVHQISGVRPRADKLDVSDRAAVSAYATSVAEQLGHVNVLINNAGIALHGELLDTTYQQIEKVLAVDFWGVVYGSKEFLPHLIASGDGHLVNISSIFGIIALPGQSAYNGAKFAVRGFTEAVRQEMLVADHPVHVTCVHPGGVKTNIARSAEIGGTHSRSTITELFDAKLARTTPERAAEIIVAGVRKNKSRVLVGWDAVAVQWVERLLGASYQPLLAKGFRRIVGHL